MTTPDEPTRGSDTGWPSDGGTTTPPPLVAADETEPLLPESELSDQADPVSEPTWTAADDAPDAPAPYAEPEPTYADPEPTYAEPEPADTVDPTYDEPEPVDPVDPTYDEPAIADAQPIYAEPELFEADPTDAEPELLEADPFHADPPYVEADPSYADPIYADPTDVDPEPVSDEPDVVEAAAPPYERLDESAVDEPEPTPAPRRPSAWRSAPVLALLLMTVLMTAATAVVWYQVHRHDQTEDARRQGVETSRDAARVLFSYDYRTLAKDFAAGKAITTGKFSNDYANTTSKVVTPVAIEKKAVVKAEVVTAGVVRATPDTVVTIVYVNQVTTSSLQSGPKVDLSRVRMTVKHVGGQWLISNVEAL